MREFAKLKFIFSLHNKTFFHFTGAARVGVWVLRWTHRFHLEDQNFNILIEIIVNL